MAKPETINSKDCTAKEVADSTKSVIAALFENLESKVSVGASNNATRLFFPNGIELISITFKVNAADGIDIQLKIAGEKGIKGTNLQEIEDAGEAHAKTVSSAPTRDPASAEPQPPQ